MMISDLRLWKDCGYTEGSMVKPPINDSLTGYDLRVTEDISPSRDRIFSEIRLRTPFDDLYLMTYLQATYEMSDGSTFTFYGWIDNVQPISDSDTPTTAIHWHIDPWRTYASNATYGSGMVTRRTRSPSLFNDPPQPVNYRYVMPKSSFRTLLSQEYAPTNTWWVCVRYTDEITVGDNGPVVRVKTACYPVTYGGVVRGVTDGTVKGSVPTLAETENGLMDELLGLDPGDIISAFISPCAPVNGSWDDEGYFRPSIGDIREGTSGTYHIVYGQPMEPVTVMDSTIRPTSDTEFTIVCGFDGETIGMLPWGLEVSGWDYRVVFESVNAYIQIRFFKKSWSFTPAESWTGSRPMGLVFTLPLPALEITENSWSSYVYGGARQADIDGRRIEADRQHMEYIRGSTGTFTQSAVHGMMTGGMLGAMLGPGGAMMGAAVGAGSALISAGMGYVGERVYQNYLTGAYDDRMQDMLDTQHAMQADGLLMQGNGFDAVRNGYRGPGVMTMTYDEYSITQWERNIDIYGITVSEPKSSCASLIRAGGPLRIDNLEVTGDIPNPARAYIRDAFRKGVILK